jgi:hypothetical protein
MTESLGKAALTGHCSSNVNPELVEGELVMG